MPWKNEISKCFDSDAEVPRPIVLTVILLTCMYLPHCWIFFIPSESQRWAFIRLLPLLPGLPGAYVLSYFTRIQNDWRLHVFVGIFTCAVFSIAYILARKGGFWTISIINCLLFYSILSACIGFGFYLA